LIFFWNSRRFAENQRDPRRRKTVSGGPSWLQEFLEAVPLEQTAREEKMFKKALQERPLLSTEPHQAVEKTKTEKVSKKPKNQGLFNRQGPWFFGLFYVKHHR
jgi:hypothetical protein